MYKYIFVSVLLSCFWTEINSIKYIRYSRRGGKADNCPTQLKTVQKQLDECKAALGPEPEPEEPQEPEPESHHEELPENQVPQHEPEPIETPTEPPEVPTEAPLMTDPPPQSPCDDAIKQALSLHGIKTNNIIISGDTKKALKRINSGKRRMLEVPTLLMHQQTMYPNTLKTMLHPTVFARRFITTVPKTYLGHRVVKTFPQTFTYSYPY